LKATSRMKVPELEFIRDEVESEVPRSDARTGWETVVFRLEDEEEDDG
jgi:hypothetical protein